MPIADAINKELYARNAELAVRNKTLSLLRKIDEVTLETLETDQMIARVVSLLDEEFSYPFAAVGLVDAKKRELSWRSFACLDTTIPLCHSTESLGKVKLTKRTHPCVEALKTKHRVVAKSLFEVLGAGVNPVLTKQFEKQAGIKSVLVFPLATGSEPIGVLVLGMNRTANDLSRLEKETFGSLLSLITIAIEKAQTYTFLQVTTKKLRSANKKLKALDSLKSEFLSIASHQLRTPLAIMKGYVAMLDNGMLGILTGEQKDALKTVGTSTEQLIMLVNHLLDLTRIEAGKLQVKMETIDATEIVNWVVEFVTPKILEKKLTLNWKPNGKVMVQADPEKLKEVVMNFMDNAVKYTEKGSITVSLSSAGGLVKIAVTDTGYGLTAEDQERMFEKFATGSASKFVKTTSGIGLYVCHKLAEAMGGTVMAESKGKGKGSTFTATFKV